MNRSLLAPGDIFDSRQHGFAQVTIVPTPFGDAVHVSGQVAWDADRKIVGREGGGQGTIGSGKAKPGPGAQKVIPAAAVASRSVVLDYS
jgi:hypothetical protein